MCLTNPAMAVENPGTMMPVNAMMIAVRMPRIIAVSVNV
jgi:hypothetical protein